MFYYILFAAYAFFLGASVASFLNVCIWRIPREESVVSPPSHCPKCNAPIRWYQNIPIVSWLLLGGRCAVCKEAISPRYILVETLGGLLFLAAYAQWANPVLTDYLPPLGMTAISLRTMPVEWLVAAGLILGSFVDLDHQWIPDRVTVGGILIGIPLCVLVPELQGESTWTGALEWSLIGAAAGFFGLWAIGWIFSKLFRKEALGFGDVQLVGAIGAFFGPAAVLFTLIVSSFAGAAVGIAMIAKGKARLGGFTAVPYGPFLALGALVWMYWGPALLKWYVALFVRRFFLQFFRSFAKWESL